jgi:hypothetical protein
MNSKQFVITQQLIAVLGEFTQLPARETEHKR